MSEHLFKQFDNDLDDIRANVTRMGGIVEDQVRAAMRAFADGDPELIESIVLRDKEVDALEVAIDEACALVVARRQPAAVDLRLIMGVGKIVTDLERIGDEARKIAKSKRKLGEQGAKDPIASLLAVQHLGRQVADMLHEVLDAFVRLDTEAAARVAKQDSDVDRHFRAIFRQLLTYMLEDARTISPAIEVLFIAKSLERVGDHAKNIAEDIVYIAQGRDIRHQGLQAFNEDEAGK